MLKSQLLSQVRRGFLCLKKGLAVQSCEHSGTVILKLRAVRLGPTVTLTLPSPPSNPVPEHHIYTTFQ